MRTRVESVKRVGLPVFILIMLIIMMNPSEVAASDYSSIIGESSEFKTGVYYIIDGETYLKSGSNVKKESLDKLLDSVRLYSNKEFTKAGEDFFNDTDIYEGWGYTGDLSDNDYIESPVGSLIYEGGPGGYLELEMESTYKIGLPVGDVQLQRENGETYWELKSKHYSKDNIEHTKGKAADGATAAYEQIIQAMKEGVVVGGVTHGINVGVAYADDPIAINKVMDERPAKGFRIENGERVQFNTGGSVWEFNTSTRKEAVMEYFMSPLFGRLEIDEAPQDEDAWDELAEEVVLTGTGVQLDSAYQQFLDEERSNETGLKPAPGMKFENGVKRYNRDKISSNTPQSYLDYNMRVIVPTAFLRSSQKRYRAMMEEGTAKTKIIDPYRISVYNNKMHEVQSDDTLESYCTLNDLDLTRDYLHLYHYRDDEGNKRGAVLVLRYDEAVVDTGAQNVYITGRKVHFGGNFMTGLVVDRSNRDSLFTTTKITGKTGVEPRALSFPVTKSIIDGGEEHDIYGNSNYHIEVNNRHSYVTFTIDFREIHVESTEGQEGDSDPGEYDGPAKRFVMVRNNYYVNDGELLDWLRTDEARAMKGVLADELSRKIQGGTGGFDTIKYADWLRMEEIKSQLRKDKDGVVPRAIGTVMILIGTFFIVVGIVLPFIYLFDIFNTVTEMSIIYLISSGRMYPVEYKDSMVPQGLLDETVLVDYKDIAKLVVVMVLIGGLFYEVDTVILILYKIYYHISQFVR